MSDTTRADTKAAHFSPTWATRESRETDAVPTWRFLEVPLTHAEAAELYRLSGADAPYMVTRALVLRYIYGGEEVRKTMLGVGVTR